MMGLKFKNKQSIFLRITLLFVWAYSFWPAWSYIYQRLTQWSSLSTLIILSFTSFIIWKIKSKNLISLSPHLTIPYTHQCFIILHLIGFLFATKILFSSLYSSQKIFTFVALHSSYFLFCLFSNSQQTLRFWYLLFLCSLFIFFQYPIQVFIAYPLRIINSQAIVTLFNLLKVDVQLTSQNILFFENQAAQVSIACSGIRSLSIGLIFFLLLSIIYRPRNHLKWLLKLLLFILCLLIENFLRISILVFCEFILKNYELSHFIHEPLGILGFIFLCFLGYRLLKNKEKHPLSSLQISLNSKLAWLLSFFILTLISFLRPIDFKQKRIFSNPTLQQPFKASFLGEDIPLTNQEKIFLNSQDVKKIIKKKFKFKSLSGSVFITLSSSWALQHNPIHCYEGAGIKVEQAGSILINKNFPVQQLSFPNNSQSGSYWFQTQNFKTDDFSARAWSDLREGPKDWWLVSVLFDRTQSSTNTDFNEFHNMLSKQLEEAQQ